jgi:hypothetical protein
MERKMEKTLLIMTMENLNINEILIDEKKIEIGFFIAQMV